MEGPNEPPFVSCKWTTTIYDYDMLGQNVLATRTGDKDDNGQGTGFVFAQQERFTSTFYYGPMGVVSRVDEGGDSDPHPEGGSADPEQYFLTDATGNHVGMLVVNGTQRDALFQYFDAFGVAVGMVGQNGPQDPQPLEAAAEYNWRGREGSESDVSVPIGVGVTEQASGLVYMQARYYDPDLGRFLQADALPISSFTTQGINRYAYVNNDPVNLTDPAGLNPLLVLGVIGMLFFFVGLAAGAWAAGGGLATGIVTNILGMLAALFPCGLPAWLMGGPALGGALGAGFSILAAIMFAIISNPILAGVAFIGVSFGLGFAIGYGIGSLFADASTGDDDHEAGPARDMYLCRRAGSRMWSEFGATRTHLEDAVAASRSVDSSPLVQTC